MVLTNFLRTSTNGQSENIMPPTANGVGGRKRWKYTH